MIKEMVPYCDIFFCSLFSHMLIVGGELYCEIFSQMFHFFPNNYFKFIFMFQLFFGLCLKLFFPNTSIFCFQILIQKNSTQTIFQGGTS